MNSGLSSPMFLPEQICPWSLGQRTPAKRGKAKSNHCDLELPSCKLLWVRCQPWLNHCPLNKCCLKTRRQLRGSEVQDGSKDNELLLASRPLCFDQPKAWFSVPSVWSQMKATVGKHPAWDKGVFTHRMSLWTASPRPPANDQIWNCSARTKWMKPTLHLQAPSQWVHPGGTGFLCPWFVSLTGLGSRLGCREGGMDRKGCKRERTGAWGDGLGSEVLARRA